MPYENLPSKRDGIADTRREKVHAFVEGAAVERIELDEFKGIFDEQEVANDQKVVAVLQREMQRDIEHLSPGEQAKIRERKMRSEALEIIVADGVELHVWFGENAHAVRTSEYDDIVNGIDVVVEFDLGEGGSEQIALAVDASMSPDFSRIEHKIQRNLKKLEGEDKLPTVKYFQSAITDYKGTLETVVPVVAGLEGKNTEALIRLASQIKQLERVKANPDESEEGRGLAARKLKELMEELASHPAQRIFLEEIKAQLDLYEKTSHNNEKNRFRIKLEKINRLARIIETILKGKSKLDRGEFEADGVYTAIYSTVTDIAKSRSLSTSKPRPAPER